jgi:hypothetical protein
MIRSAKVTCNLALSGARRQDNPKCAIGNAQSEMRLLSAGAFVVLQLLAARAVAGHGPHLIGEQVERVRREVRARGGHIPTAAIPAFVW